ncbi:DUF1433 domain-containing protein [Fructilactobacillus florum]|uniref:DUF1433 domain-containing protein n=1 Tax=Fructilactobacillus florum TaxID=640331 RepID=UPI0020939608|nr:DUF1433 domain-containing protein [Fructilactobacillus florum]
MKKRKALKKYETEIVKDLSNRYTGIKDVEFTKYTTTPLGTVYFNFYINQNKQKDRISKYAIDEDSKKTHFNSRS